MLQVLLQFSDAQWHGPIEERNPVPCMLLQEAAGVHTRQRQEDACARVRADSIRALIDIGLPETTLKNMDEAITLDSIGLCALEILRIPELLYLPSCVKQHLLTCGAAETGRDLERLCMRLAFVSSPHVSVAFYHVWDAQRLHLQQVSSTPYCSFSSTRECRIDSCPLHV